MNIYLQIYILCVHIYSIRASVYRTLEVEIRACYTHFHNDRLSCNAHCCRVKESHMYVSPGKEAGYMPDS